MNFKPIYGWYYKSLSERSASWSGVVYLYNFLIGNTTKGVFAEEVPLYQIELGDLIQLGDSSGHFYHTLVVTKTGPIPAIGNILINTHTFDALHRPLDTYHFQNIRFLHIKGVYIT